MTSPGHVDELTQWQRQHLNQLVTDIMIAATMQAIDPGFRATLRDLGEHCKPGETAADLIKQAMDDFPKSFTNMRSSLFEPFLQSLANS